MCPYKENIANIVHKRANIAIGPMYGIIFFSKKSLLEKYIKMYLNITAATKGAPKYISTLLNTSQKLICKPYDRYYLDITYKYSKANGAYNTICIIEFTATNIAQYSL